MKSARVIIGSGFGDEGKGLFTDYLCAREGAGMVVRFNGGAQAGHTVCTPAGQRHVFSHFGAGTFCHVPTFLSKYFIVNPILYLQELENIVKLGISPVVYADPACKVTTFADMIINQRLEDRKGTTRHGSVGVGINETWERSQLSHLDIRMADLWNGIDLEPKLLEICGKYAKFRTGEHIDSAIPMIEAFKKACALLANMVQPLGIAQCEDPVFEGAQGLLLDQDNKEFFPHVTRSHTGMRNVRKLCGLAGIDNIRIYYVSRTYLTRHGAGPLPGHDPAMAYADDTNVPHPYQGSLRFAPLDTVALHTRCKADAGATPYALVLTHCDQLAAPCPSGYTAHGPTRTDVEKHHA